MLSQLNFLFVNILLENTVEAESRGGLKRFKQVWYRTQLDSIKYNDLFFTTLFSGKLKLCSTSSEENNTSLKNPNQSTFTLSFLVFPYSSITDDQQAWISMYTPMNRVYSKAANCIQGAGFSSHHKTQIYKKGTLKKKKLSHVFHLMVHLVYFFRMFATWCGDVDVYWQYNPKDRTYQQLLHRRKD